MRRIVFCLSLCAALLGIVSVSKADPAPPSFIPADRERITAQNAEQVRLLGTVGYGWAYNDVDWSPDGKTIAVGSFSGPLLFDAANLSVPPRVLTSIGSNETQQVQFNPDGKELRTRSSSGTQLWNLNSGQMTETESFGESDLDQSPNGRWKVIPALAFYPRNHFSVYEKGNEQAIATINGRWLGFSVNNEMIYMSQEGKELIRQAVIADETHILVNFNEDVYGAVLSPNRENVALIVAGLSLRFFDAQSGERKVSISLSPRQDSLKFSRDSTRLLAYSLNGHEVDLWGVKDLLEKQENAGVIRLTMPDLWMSSVAFSPESTRVAVTTCGFTDYGACAAESELWIWNLSKNLPVPETRLHFGYFGPVLSADATRLAYQGLQWNLTEGRSQALDGHYSPTHKPRSGLGI